MAQNTQGPIISSMLTCAEANQLAVSGAGRPREDRARIALTPTKIARFWAKVKRQGEGDCWPWQAGAYPSGYGMFLRGRYEDGRCSVDYGHRIAFEVTYGPPPDGMAVMHTCDVPACCNPAHLRLGTQGDNVRDALAKGRFRGGTRLFHDSAHRHQDRYAQARRETRADRRQRTVRRPTLRAVVSGGV
jgi:hypothetical protein